MEIKIDIKGFKELERNLKLTSRELERAAVMTLNKVIAKGKTEMKRAISSEFSVTQQEVARKLMVQKAKRGSPVAVLEASERRGRSFNLIRFMEKKVSLVQYRKRRKAEGRPQLRFKIKRGGGYKTIKGAFVGNKGRTVFKRTGKGRLPIKPLQTVGVPGMFASRRVSSRVVERIRKELPVEMDRAVAQVIRKRFKR